MRIFPPIFLIAALFAGSAHGGFAKDVIFSDGFDEALASGFQRPACPPWTRAGSPKDDPELAATTLEEDGENRFGEGKQAGVCALSDFSAEKQAYLLGNGVFDSQAVEVSFDFIESEGKSSGGSFYVNVGGSGDKEGTVAVRLNFIKGRLLNIKNAYVVEQKVSVRVAVNNSTDPVKYGDRPLPPRTFDVWIDGKPVIEAEPFNAESGSVIAPGTALTSLGFLTYSAPTTAQKVYLKNIKVSSLP